MSEEHSKPFANEDDDERHRREEAERRAKRKVSLLHFVHVGSCWFMLVHVGGFVCYRSTENSLTLIVDCVKGK